MKRFKVLLGALVCMCMAFLITPVAQAADAPQNGWIQEEDGYYYYENGMMVTYQLIEDPNGYTYYVGEDGRMVTDTLEWVDGGNRYFNESGAMVTSAWEQITTYYEDDYEEWSWTDWYYFGSDGIAYTGVQTVNGVEYFFYGGGTLADSATVTYDETHIVKVNDAGVVIDKAEIQYNNWTYMGGEWYWFDDVYEPAQDIREIYGYTYYFDDGQMIKDRIVYTEMGRRAFDADGHMVENSWFLPTNHYERRWYYFGEEGVAGEGWFLYGSDWYYLENGAARVGDYVMDYYGQDIYYAFDTDGRMIKSVTLGTGWLQVDTAWYYYDGTRLLENEWKYIDGYYYYFGESRQMSISTLVDDGGEGYYVIDSYGHWVKNQWVALEDSSEPLWCYADENGKALMDTWKLFYDTTWYYFDGAIMVDEPILLEGKVELFSANGIWLGTSSVETGWVATDYSWYYLDNNHLVTGWQYINGLWYYFDEYTYLAYCSDYYYIDGVKYLFNDSAALANGWVLSQWGDWYLSDGNGVLLTGWQLVNGTWYYLDDYMYEDGVYEIDNELHSFASNGAWLGAVGKLADGWQQIAGEWYYFEDGSLRDGWIVSSGQVYYCAYKMLANDWIWAHFYSDLGNKIYFYGFDASGALARNKWIYIEELEEWVWCDKEGVFTWMRQFIINTELINDF